MSKSPQIKTLEASAGSGKTYQLTLHFVTLILSGFNFRNVLAITFTNDAVNEMKHRILDWMKKVSQGDEKTIKKLKEYDDSGYLARFSDRQLSKNAITIVREILENYLDFNVQTIDSFINTVALSSSVEMGLPPRYDIEMNPSECIEYVVDDVLSGLKSGSRISGIFDDFITSYLTTESSGIWNPKKLFLKNIEFLYEKEKTYGLKFKSGGSLERLVDLREKIKNDLINYGGTLKKNRTAGSIIRKATEFDFEKITETQLEEMPARLRKKMDDYFKLLSRTRLGSYISIYRAVEEKLQEYKHARRIVFISDLNMEVSDYIKKGSVPSIYYMLGEKINHYLIDEFQDTSEIQWKNLFPLVENSLASGGSLFYVGDKKQALYRFRGGQAGLFDIAKNDFLIKNKKGYLLDRNFRSKKKIVEFNNKIFSMENLAKTGLAKNRLSSYTTACQKASRRKDPGGGRVVVKKLFAEKNKEELDEMTKENIIPLISDLCARYNRSDIAILVRKNEEVRKITSWLLAESYPVVSEITMSARENSVIRGIISFLGFLEMPSDNLSFASFVSGDIFRAVSGIERRAIFSFFEEKRLFGSFDGRPLYILFSERFGPVYDEYIGKILELSNRLAPYDIVRLILDKYDIQKKFPGHDAFIMRMLEILKDRENLRENSLINFLDHWQKAEPEEFQVVLPKFIDAVNVSTIHKAKGLSYPVVVLPFLPAQKKENKHVVKDGTLDLRYIKKDYLIFSAELRKMQCENEEEELLDDLNSLYVGMTRAADELYVYMLESDRNRNPFTVMFENCNIGVSDETEFVRKIKDAIQNPCGILTSKSKVHWSERIRKEEVDLDYYTDAKRMRCSERGVFIHHILSKIDTIDSLDEFPYFLESLINNSAAEMKFDGDKNEIKTTILNAMEKMELSKWFGKAGRNEVEFVSSGGEKFRIDRIIFLDGGMEIIEYKTGEEYSEKHIFQLKNYMRNIGRIYGTQAVEGSLFYIDECKVIRIKK